MMVLSFCQHIIKDPPHHIPMEDELDDYPTGNQNEYTRQTGTRLSHRSQAQIRIAPEDYSNRPSSHRRGPYVGR